MGDPERYRTKDEVTKWEKNDPIGIFRRRLIKDETATEKELDALDQEAMEEIEAAVQFAEESPNPTWDDLVNTVYVEGVG